MPLNHAPPQLLPPPPPRPRPHHARRAPTRRARRCRALARSKESKLEFMSSALAASCPSFAAAPPEGAAKTERGRRKNMTG
jgi:hypothetical protein